MTVTERKALKALLVDDDKFLLELVTKALEGLGVEHVGTRTDGKSALTFLDQHEGEVDLLLCDLNMPGMDGIEFLRHLAQRKYAGSIVVMSGVDMRILKTAENLARAHSLQILGALEKPVTRKALVEMLGRLGSTNQQKPRKPTEQVSEEELRRGLKGNEVTPFFQPKVEVATRKVVGVETLARWNRPGHGIVGPEAFVPVAERYGLIDSLTTAVFVKAMRYGRDWRSKGLDLKVAVNISVDSLRQLDLPEQIVLHAAEQQMEISQIMLEVTESRLMQDITSALEVLMRLRLKGIALSIDDFGTGYSSMEQLKRIPFDELKIDQSFVSGAGQDSAARAILESSVRLAQELGMKVVAEGVETLEDWNLVAQLGCHMVQGYFVAEPMPGEQLPEWITEWYLGGRSTRWLD